MSEGTISAICSPFQSEPGLVLYFVILDLVPETDLMSVQNAVFLFGIVLSRGLTLEKHHESQHGRGL